MIYTAIVETPNARNVKHVEAPDAVQAADKAASASWEPCTVRILEHPAVRAVRNERGNVVSWSGKFSEPPLSDGSWDIPIAKPGSAEQTAKVFSAIGKSGCSMSQARKTLSPGAAHSNPLPEIIRKTITEGYPITGIGTYFQKHCEQAADMILENPTEYPLKFCEWLVKNWETWDAFCRVSNTARMEKKFTHWSAFAAAAIIRWETSTADSTGDFKVNNNYLPYLARVYNAVSGTSFYRTKGRAKP